MALIHIDPYKTKEIDSLSFADSLPDETDVVVIGGGIIGTSSAYRLAKRGVRVLLLEKDTIAYEQSGRNWGWAENIGRAPITLPLLAASNQLFSGLTDELETDIEWVQGGCLLLARDEEAANEYESWYRIAKYAELDTEVLTVKQAKALIPDIKASFLMALHNPANGHANPLKATLAFAKAAVQAGAQILTGLTVNRIVTSGGRVIGVDSEAGHVRCSIVVCAAGRWTQRLLRRIGVDMPQTVGGIPVIMTKPLPPLTNKMIWSKVQS